MLRTNVKVSMLSLLSLDTHTYILSLDTHTYTTPHPLPHQPGKYRGAKPPMPTRNVLKGEIWSRQTNFHAYTVNNDMAPC